MKTLKGYDVRWSPVVFVSLFSSYRVLDAGCMWAKNEGSYHEYECRDDKLRCSRFLIVYQANFVMEE